MDERFDIFTEFARSYLSTPAEKAVYLSLVAATGSPRTVEELAGETDLDPHEVANVLERFEAAGIVRSVEEADVTTRYVWDRDMEYLRTESEDPFGWIDPVCGMPVRPETPYTAGGPRGGERRFCSASCLATFREAPTAFDGRREDSTSGAWLSRSTHASRLPVGGCVEEAIDGGYGQEQATKLLAAVRRFARRV